MSALDQIIQVIHQILTILITLLLAGSGVFLVAKIVDHICEWFPSASTDLQQFYDDYWALYSYPGTNTFDSKTGLCTNLSCYMRSMNWSAERREAVHQLLKKQFKQAGLHGGYPFNKDCHEYFSEVDYTKNPARIEWVRNHIS